MLVYKFGGASVKDAESIRNMVDLIENSEEKPDFIVISAMGKSTNALEKVVALWKQKEKEKAIAALEEITEQHLQVIRDLWPGNHLISEKLILLKDHVINALAKISTVRSRQNIYPLIVSLGELFSTLIIHEYMESIGLKVVWTDARNFIKTKEDAENSPVVFYRTKPLLQNLYKKAQTEAPGHMIITQGFISSSNHGKITTLGREGSDYTASLIAGLLEADKLVIWKDVPGFMTADPAKYPDAVVLEKLPYSEAVELAYYGAKILHPKTIKPIYEQRIPLYLKSFLHAEAPGTLISYFDEDLKIPPCYIEKGNQVLFSLSTRDLSFINEHHIRKIYSLFEKQKIKIRLMQNAALSLSFCFDYDEKRLELLTESLKDTYEVRYNHPVKLFNIRYYDNACENKVAVGHRILLEQKSRRNLQLVAEEI